MQRTAVSTLRAAPAVVPQLSARVLRAQAPRPHIAVHAAATAAAPQQEQNAVAIVKLPPRQGAKGPRPDAEVQQTAQAVISALTVEKKAVAILSSPQDQQYLTYELLLVLADVFAKHKAAQLTVRKFSAKADAQAQQQPPRVYYRLAVTPAPAGFAAAPVKQTLAVKKDGNAIKLAMATIGGLQTSGGAVQLAAVGAFASASLVEAVQRASVRARTDLQQQLVVTSVALEEKPSVKDADPARGPVKAVVVTLQLVPAPPPPPASA